jgi:hypothetical protein
MSHLSHDDLTRWRDAGGDADRVLGHLAGCPECRRALAALVRESPPPEVPAHVRAKDFTPQGHAAHRAPRRVGAVGAAFGAGLAAAAALAIVLLRPAAAPSPASPPPPPVPVASAGVRGSDIQLREPAGAVRGAVEFRWSSPLAASRYRLEVRDAKGVLVYEARATAEHAPLPDEVRVRLRPGETYTWSVDGLDAGGDVVVRSRPLGFTVAP